MARELRALGFDAVALKGGLDAWRVSSPVERADVGRDAGKAE